MGDLSEFQLGVALRRFRYLRQWKTSLITQAPPCGATSVAHLPEQPRQSLLHTPLAPAPETTPCLDSPLLVAPSAPSVVPPAVVAPSLPHLPPRPELVAHTPANAVALVILVVVAAAAAAIHYHPPLALPSRPLRPASSRSLFPARLPSPHPPVPSPSPAHPSLPQAGARR